MKTLTEKEAEDFLEKNSFNVVQRQLVRSKSNLKKINIDFPWVMKISSSHIIHKAKLGGTILNITNISQAEKAFDKLMKINACKKNKCFGVLVQPMIKGQELIIGLKNTPEFGHVILVGAGGSEVEELKDTSFRICPITTKDSSSMLKDLKINISNKKELSKNLLKISALTKRYPKIKELDINPLILNKLEAVVVDARIFFD